MGEKILSLRRGSILFNLLIRKLFLKFIPYSTTSMHITNGLNSDYSDYSGIAGRLKKISDCTK